MTAKIIDGKQVAADIRAELKQEVAKLKEQGIVPGLGVILVGDDPASMSYVTGKEHTCDELGIYSDHHHLPAERHGTRPSPSRRPRRRQTAAISYFPRRESDTEPDRASGIATTPRAEAAGAQRAAERGINA